MPDGFTLTEAPDLRPAEYADDFLALRFAERHRERLRFVAAWGKWLIWDGSTWRFDDTLQAFDLARVICREASAALSGKQDDRQAEAVASAKTVAAIERLAKVDRRHAATVGQWDADPWRLNTPGGVIDLRTGTRHPHDPTAHMTKVTAVAAEGHCPLWLTFLDRITEGRRDLVDFLQRAAGYALTGSTRDHALLFLHGSGGNGKGVFLNTITAILGDYAAVADMATFTAGHGDRHPTDLAMLRGARLVTAQETEEGRQWAEARIKALTGGDPITARFMRQDFFTFTPQFKLFISGNHKPALRNVDDAIRRRFHLVPFDARIGSAERDPDLAGKLRGEWSGILAWMIEGCLAWQRGGLAPPDIVRAATDDYLATEDALATWIGECCKPIGYGQTETGPLFHAWSAWAKATGEAPGTMKAFRQNLTRRGYQPTQDPGTRRSAFKGIALDNVRSHWSDGPDG